MKLPLRAITAVVLALLAAPLAAGAQPARNVPRIGYLAAGSVEIEKSWFAAFQQGLRELGYVEGKTIVIEQRYAAGRYERLPELAAELVRLKVDVLVATPAAAAHAAKKATSAIPIVMQHGDPVGTGLVASLAHPGGNVTGLSTLHGDLGPKRLQLLKEIVPSASRVAVLLNPANPANVLQLKDVQAAASI
jgi:putative ABC transport system substrate-binding protein